MYCINESGSSDLSMDAQAITQASLFSSCRHWDKRNVLPKPAGASSKVTGLACSCTRRWISFSRRQAPSSCRGGDTFVLINQGAMVCLICKSCLMGFMDVTSRSHLSRFYFKAMDCFISMVESIQQHGLPVFGLLDVIQFNVTKASDLLRQRGNLNGNIIIILV